jgi:L-arabinonolactonase
MHAKSHINPGKRMERNSMMQLAVDGKHTLGEGILWCERTGRLLWTDIQASLLWCHTPATGATISYALPERLASFALTDDANRLLLGLASGLAFYDLDTGALQRICDVEADQPSTRLNDGRCDRQGRFVFGMFNQDSDPRLPIGGFYRLHHDLRLERLPLPPAAIANSICFSLEGTTMYFCDSQEKRIYQCDYGDVLGEPRLFADLTVADGEPDGSSIDSEGHLWNAFWGGKRLIRFAPDGSVERILRLAAPHPTCVAFGGPDLKTVYATSATMGLSPDDLKEFPASGGVFQCEVDVAGLPEPRFLG